MALMLLAPCFAGDVTSHALGNRSPTEDRSDAERVVGAERLTTGSSVARVQPFLAGRYKVNLLWIASLLFKNICCLADVSCRT